MVELKEAMQARHMVRQYTNEPIGEDLVSALKARAAWHNMQYDLAMQLFVNNEQAFNALIKLVLAKNVKNYFLLAGSDTPNLDEKLGYSSADLMLYAQTLGLNTWWVGGTFSRKNMAKLSPGHKVIGVVAIGYGANQGTAHKSKTGDAVSSFAGQTPEWFEEGVQAALLAPTARNKQAFFIKGEGNKVAITCDNGIFTGADLGLVKYHFELGAGKDNFEWV